MIIGDPLKLSVFCPSNRDLQVTCFKESIKLQPDQPYNNYSIKAPCQLSEGCTISFNSFNSHQGGIKLTGWSKEWIDIQLVEDIEEETTTTVDSTQLFEDIEEEATTTVDSTQLFEDIEEATSSTSDDSSTDEEAIIIDINICILFSTSKLSNIGDILTKDNSLKQLNINDTIRPFTN